MGNLEKLLRIEKKFPWSFSGVILAIVFGLFGLYSEWIKENKAMVQFDIFSNIPVLEVREEMSNLQIFYDGINMQESKQQLRLISFKVSNSGKADILKIHYDEKDPFGIAISFGKILKADVIDYSNSYLKRNLDLKYASLQKVVFPSIILEPGDFFTIKILVITEEGKIPEIVPTGKIAGIKAFSTHEIYKESGKASFLNLVFSGSPLIQITRLIGYFAATAILLGLVSVFGGAISSRLEKRERKNIVKSFKKVTYIEVTDEDKYIFNNYIEHGKGYLDSILKMVTDVDYYKSLLDEDNQGPPKYWGIVPFPIEQLMQPHIAHELIEVGFINKENDAFIVNHHMLDVLSSFLDFVIKTMD